MALTNTQRLMIYKKFSQLESQNFTPIGVIKTDLRQALNDIDDWVDANFLSLNNAISQPARSTLTKKQKLRLFMSILKTRREAS